MVGGVRFPTACECLLKLLRTWLYTRHALDNMTAFTPHAAHHKKFFTRWYTQFCPRHEECSDTAWAKTQKCKSYESEEDCRLKILDHFTRSGKHNSQPEEALCASAENAEIRTARDPGHWFDEPPCETPGHETGGIPDGDLHTTKRQRLSSGADDIGADRVNLLSKARSAGIAEDAKVDDEAEPGDEEPQTHLQHYGNAIAKASAVAVTHAVEELLKVICAGRGCCSSNAIAGGLAGIRNK